MSKISDSILAVAYLYKDVVYPLQTNIPSVVLYNVEDGHQTLIDDFNGPLSTETLLVSSTSVFSDAGFASGGPKHRVLMTTEAVAAVSSFIPAKPHSADREKVLVIDAGGSTLDLPICCTHGRNATLYFTPSDVIGSITHVWGANYLMRFETYFKKQLDQRLDSTRDRLTWPILQQHVRRELKGSLMMKQVLQDHPRCQISLDGLGQFADDTSAGIARNRISLSE
ncbi:MAG: hypothetical protein M1830_001015 [Pleopsidium flavum]|nr:MAG: hypothetical protein M1830_001015 [Pleopsidium flavum]